YIQPRSARAVAAVMVTSGQATEYWTWISGNRLKWADRVMLPILNNYSQLRGAPVFSEHLQQSRKNRVWTQAKQRLTCMCHSTRTETPFSYQPGLMFIFRE